MAGRVDVSIAIAGSTACNVNALPDWLVLLWPFMSVEVQRAVLNSTERIQLAGLLVVYGIPVPVVYYCLKLFIMLTVCINRMSMLFNLVYGAHVCRQDDRFECMPRKRVLSFFNIIQVLCEVLKCLK